MWDYQFIEYLFIEVLLNLPMRQNGLKTLKSDKRYWILLKVLSFF